MGKHMKKVVAAFVILVVLSTLAPIAACIWKPEWVEDEMLASAEHLVQSDEQVLRRLSCNIQELTDSGAMSATESELLRDKLSLWENKMQVDEALLENLKKRRTQPWPALLAGYWFAVVVAHLLVSMTIDESWKAIGRDGKNAEAVRPSPWQPRAIGCLERGLFVTSWHLGFPQFMGLWIALKVAAKWKRWGEDTYYGSRWIVGREIFNNFLIGSGLSIAYAVVGAKMTEWLAHGRLMHLVIVPIVLIVATLVIWAWARLQEPKENGGWLGDTEVL